MYACRQVLNTYPVGVRDGAGTGRAVLLERGLGEPRVQTPVVQPVPAVGAYRPLGVPFA